MKNNMIGKRYTFYLSNIDLRNSYYVYQITSPRLNRKTLVPYLSLSQVVEKTGRKDERPRHDGDILMTYLGERKQDFATKCKELVSRFLEKDNAVVLENGVDFPLIEMKPESTNIQEALIVNIRSLFRKKNYRLTPGNYVDVLYSPDTFVLYKVAGKGEAGPEREYWLEAVGLFKTDDAEMKNPLSMEGKTFSTSRWSNLGEMARAIKVMEWIAFGNNKPF